jgi:Sodium/hydrogen exchanger family
MSTCREALSATRLWAASMDGLLWFATLRDLADHADHAAWWLPPSPNPRALGIPARGARRYDDIPSFAGVLGLRKRAGEQVQSRDDHLSYDNLLIVLAVAAAVPFVLGLFPRLPLPGPVLEIVAGVVLGPAALDVVHADTAVQAFSTIGLGFLLFLAGVEIDVHDLFGIYPP